MESYPTVGGGIRRERDGKVGSLSSGDVLEGCTEASWGLETNPESRAGREHCPSQSYASDIERTVSFEIPQGPTQTIDMDHGQQKTVSLLYRSFTSHSGRERSETDCHVLYSAVCF